MVKQMELLIITKCTRAPWSSLQEALSSPLLTEERGVNFEILAKLVPLCFRYIVVYVVDNA